MYEVAGVTEELLHGETQQNAILIIKSNQKKIEYKIKQQINQPNDEIWVSASTNVLILPPGMS